MFATDTNISLAIYIFTLPLCALVLLLFNKFLFNKGDILAQVAVGISMFLSIILLCDIIGADAYTLAHQIFDWLQISPPQSDNNNSDSYSFLHLGILIDRLTCIMLVIITCISFCAHLFSAKFMSDDIRYNRYCRYMLLFTSSMIGLVLADNLLSLFIFWELVGLCSYLLIGHWYEKPSAHKAAIKTFITTRIGDVGMVVALIVCFKTVGSLQFVDMFNAISSNSLSDSTQTLLGLGLFVAAMGKSAQFPLHIWLPNAAAESPTPAGAMINSVTMTAAGVYLLARMFPIFDEQVLRYIAYTGAITALFAAILAAAQNNIQKILAYSTASQLGLMFLGIGIGAYSASIFHLTTHAFFKAGLFLGAGAVIYAMRGEQSILKFGGLYDRIPKVTCCYLLCSLALVGLPLFSGFWSQKSIVDTVVSLAASGSGYDFLLFATMASVFLTAFYTARQFLLIFTGDKQRDKKLYEHADDPTLQMFVPLVMLSALAVLAGGIFDGSWFKSLYPQIPLNQQIISMVSAEHGTPLSNLSEIIQIGMYDGIKNNSSWLVTFISILLTLGGAVIASLLYFKYPRKSSASSSPTRSAKFFIFLDDFGNIISQWAAVCANAWGRFVAAFDNIILDRVVISGSAGVLRAIGSKLSLLQSGNIRNYFLLAIIGIIILAIAMTN